MVSDLLMGKGLLFPGLGLLADERLPVGGADHRDEIAIFGVGDDPGMFVGPGLAQEPVHAPNCRVGAVQADQHFARLRVLWTAMLVDRLSAAPALIIRHGDLLTAFGFAWMAETGLRHRLSTPNDGL